MEDQIGVATVDATGGHISGTIELTGLVTGTDGERASRQPSLPFDCPTVVAFVG